MTTLNDLLRSRAIDSLPEGTNSTTKLNLLSNESADRVVVALVEFFGEDDTRQAVELLLDSESVGFVTRAGLYDFVSILEKGIGDAELSIIPGAPQFRLLALRCPVAGCNQQMLVTLIDEKKLWKCSLHPDKVMELVK